MDVTKISVNAEPITALDMHGKLNENLVPFTNRIPNFIELLDGTILYIYNIKYDSQLDEADGCTILMRSHDGGETWGEMRLLRYDGMPSGISSGTLVYDEVNDALIILARTRHWKPEYESDAVVAEKDQINGKSYERFWVAKSFDGGLTWSDYKEIFIEGTPKNWTIQHATTPGIGIQLKHQTGAKLNGRLVIPTNRAEMNNGENEFKAHLIISDDFGETWRVGALQEHVGANESVVTELSDGTIIHNCRNQGGVPENLRIQAFSRDGGESFNYSTTVDTLYDPVCHAGFTSAVVDKNEYIFITLPSGEIGPLIKVFGTPQHMGRREILMLYISSDGGKTYKAVKALTEKNVHAAYSALCVTRSGKLLCAWETGPDFNKYRDICYTRLDLNDVLK